ncbi:MAG TPA: hypothetical protein VFZ09_00925 [Archangium sp.]|uniref:hypothetical protein n=1 Tax=Archangium sp. TaxID=1872627 RepID=UPI002E34A59B|nr:hypothetical protein [Archangium sp.]HEX5744770.1 hypothetical protein [Archangium sp.]
MNSHSAGRIMIAAFALLFFGCVPARVSLRQDFWKDSRHTVGVAVGQMPPLHVYPLPEAEAAAMGPLQGAVYMEIRHQKTGTLESHLQLVDVSRFGAVADHYVEKLQALGFSARKLSGPVNMESLPPFQAKESGEFARKDMRSLAQQEGIDMLVLLSVDRCGTKMLPFWEMEAMCVASGELIDLRTNRVEWRARMEEEEGTKPIKEWNQAPDFPGVSKSLGEAVTQAQQYLVRDFFRGTPGAPPPGCSETPEFRAASAVEKKRLLSECAKAKSASAAP